MAADSTDMNAGFYQPASHAAKRGGERGGLGQCAIGHPMGGPIAPNARGKLGNGNALHICLKLFLLHLIPFRVLHAWQ